MYDPSLPVSVSSALLRTIHAPLQDAAVYVSLTRSRDGRSIARADSVTEPDGGGVVGGGVDDEPIVHVNDCDVTSTPSLAEIVTA